MSIRLASAGRLFLDGGLSLVSTWQAFDTLTDEQRATLRDRHGRWVKVHPDDLDKLEAIGLYVQADDDGNPHMHLPLAETSEGDDSNTPVTGDDSNTPAPRKRGRPRKVKV